MTHKIAVDSTAEEYWEQYFGAYGKQWVRKIPRRVATALAGRTAGIAPAASVSAVVTPILARPVITAERVCLEGAVDLTVDGRTSRRLFCAEFDHTGALLSLDSVSAPLVG